MFKKKMRNEEYFYNMIMELTPKEMIAFTKAVTRVMNEMKNLKITK